jgi:hypothetical protein
VSGCRYGRNPHSDDKQSSGVAYPVVTIAVADLLAVRGIFGGVDALFGLQREKTTILTDTFDAEGGNFKIGSAG